MVKKGKGKRKRKKPEASLVVRRVETVDALVRTDHLWGEGRRCGAHGNNPQTCLEILAFRRLKIPYVVFGWIGLPQLAADNRDGLSRAWTLR